MSGTSERDTTVYQIRISGQFDKWAGSVADWFDGMMLSFEPDGDALPTTTLTVSVVDQAKLRGILNKLWDMNLTVISMNRLDHSGGEQ